LVTFIARRLAAAIPILIAVTFLIYLLVSLAPGDPARALAGPDASDETVERIRVEYGLNQPLLFQYWQWLVKAVHLDFGESRVSRLDVATGIAERLPVTLGLVIVAILIAVLAAIPIGVVAGATAGGRVDGILATFLGLALAIPNFVLAIVFVLFFGLQLHWLPMSGYVPFTVDPVGWLRHIILPAVAIAASLLSVLARQLRTGMVETLGQNYLRAAWARGSSTARVVGLHGLRNASIPAVTILGIQAATVLGSTVLVEQIFALPGIGNYLLSAVLIGDIPVIQGVVVIFVVVQVVSSLIVDVSYGILNPKLRVA
jgi:peptide/nickel transport system permease protein